MRVCNYALCRTKHTNAPRTRAPRLSLALGDVAAIHGSHEDGGRVARGPRLDLNVPHHDLPPDRVSLLRCGSLRPGRASDSGLCPGRDSRRNLKPRDTTRLRLRHFPQRTRPERAPSRPRLAPPRPLTAST
eukprot:3665710-Rhodomonas_salina.1